MNIPRATTDELYTMLQEIDATPTGGDERLKAKLAARAERIEEEIERRAYDESDPWSPQNHHD